MNADNPLCREPCDAKREHDENKRQSETQQCTLTDEFSILKKENEAHGKYYKGSAINEHEKEQKEKTNKSGFKEGFVLLDKDHHKSFTTHNIKSQDHVSDSTKPEDDENLICPSGSVNSQEDSDGYGETSSLTKSQEDKGYFSHSPGSSSTSHSSSSEKLVQDSDQIPNEDQDDCSSTEYHSSSSENLKQDNEQYRIKDEVYLEHREPVSFGINDDYKEEWHVPTVPSNSPIDEEQINGSHKFKSDTENDNSIKFSSGKEYTYDRSSFSKTTSFKHNLQNFFKDETTDESKHQDSLEGGHTPPLPPNTLAPPSKVTSTNTSIQVRYPPPTTSAIYYDSLPEPKEEVLLNFEEKKKNIEQVEFVHVLRDKLRKLQILTGCSKSKICDYDRSDVDDNDDYKDEKDHDGDECNKGLIRPPLKRQSSFTIQLPQKNLSNLTEVLSNIHATKTQEKKCESERRYSLKEGPQEESNTNKPVLKKSSSLKYDKTPPDQKQQSKKKIVKFADVFGMDLVEVRTFMAGTPAISRSSFTDTQVELPPSYKTRSLRSLFDAPIVKPNFWDRVNKEKVCLEQMFTGKDLSVKGIIRVLNISCEKYVTIRHSFDNWKNYHETTATYLSGSSDGRTDQFSFLLWGNFLQDNGTLVFCIRYQTAGQEFWDNNEGEDYKLQCYAMPTPVQGLGQERNSRSRQQASSYQLAQAESLYSEFERLREHSPADPWMHRYL